MTSPSYSCVPSWLDDPEPDPDPVLQEIEQHITETGIAATTIGRLALRDPRLVDGLLAGRILRDSTRQRLREWLRESRRALDEHWHWREQPFSPVLPSQIATFHISGTLRAAWNAAMPLHYRVNPPTRRLDPAHYTRTYLGEAIMHLGNETLTREVKRTMMRPVRQMLAHLGNITGVPATTFDAAPLAIRLTEPR